MEIYIWCRVPRVLNDLVLNFVMPQNATCRLSCVYLGEPTISISSRLSTPLDSNFLLQTIGADFIIGRFTLAILLHFELEFARNLGICASTTM